MKKRKLRERIAELEAQNDRLERTLNAYSLQPLTFKTFTIDLNRGDNGVPEMISIPIDPRKDKQTFNLASAGLRAVAVDTRNVR